MNLVFLLMLGVNKKEVDLSILEKQLTKKEGIINNLREVSHEVHEKG